VTLRIDGGSANPTALNQIGMRMPAPATARTTL
jgi:hypothetical protein